MKVIHQTVLVVIKTVISVWLLRMDQRCRTAESARAHHKLRGIPVFCAVISQLMSYIPSQIGRWRVQKVMLKMKTEFKQLNPLAGITRCTV
jgi:hypothetical protein